MASEDDDRPKKKISHEIGQDLSLLSVEELTERIAQLGAEPLERQSQPHATREGGRAARDRQSRTPIASAAYWGYEWQRLDGCHGCSNAARLRYARGALHLSTSG